MSLLSFSSGVAEGGAKVLKLGAIRKEAVSFKHDILHILIG
jgi:hypothetical protein